METGTEREYLPHSLALLFGDLSPICSTDWIKSTSSQGGIKHMDLEILRGFDLDLPAILELFPPEKVIETIGWEKIIQNLNASTLNEQERELLIEQVRQLNEKDN